ncbi:MAG: hypothetical protein K6F68_00510 [Clostridiales bacterium]|nr:hypothetical protein [Clostridiales bacterium]
MNELGLTLAEKIVYAVVAGYTEYKGFFDGEASWLSGWTNESRNENERILRSLNEKGLIYVSGKMGNTVRYKVSALGGTGKRRNAGSGSDNVSIDSIDSIDSIEKEKYRKSIDSIDASSIESSIDSIDSKRRSDPSRERIIALMDEYGDITKVPYERLAEACGKVSN